MNTVEIPEFLVTGVLIAFGAIGTGAGWLIKTLILRDRARSTVLKETAQGMTEVVSGLEEITGLPSMRPPASTVKEERIDSKVAIVLTPELVGLVKGYVEQMRDDERKKARVEQIADAEAREANRGQRLDPGAITPHEAPRGREQSRRLTPERPRHIQAVESPLPPPPPKKTR